MPPISTKQTITSHLNSFNTKKTMTYDNGNPGLSVEKSMESLFIFCNLSGQDIFTKKINDMEFKKNQKHCSLSP
jgi:hypothetical protein